MKVKVIHGFRDQHTDEWHEVNETMEVTQKRYKEILEKGKLVEPVTEPKENAETKKRVTRKRGEEIEKR